MRKELLRKAGLAASGAIFCGAAVTVAAAPAQAAALGCTYPYVCLYNSSDVKVEQYKVITSDYQSFKRTDVYYGVNTRNDDVAYIRYTNGNVACIPAGQSNTVWDLRYWGTPNGIRISSDPTCWQLAQVRAEPDKHHRVVPKAS